MFTPAAGNAVADHESEPRGAASPVPWSVLWIGDPGRSEFAAAYSVAARYAQVIVRAMPDDVAFGDEAHAPAVICLAQAFAGQFDDFAVLRLRRRFPGVPLVVLVGGWSEGELRTGRPQASACRIPWAAAAGELDAQLRLLHAGICPTWGYGDTLAEDERAVLPSPPSIHGADRAVSAPLPQKTTIGLRIADEALRRLLADACRSRGVVVVVDLENAAGPAGMETAVDTVIWAPPADAIAAQCGLSQTIAYRPHAPVVALLNFLRSDQAEAWRRRGVAAIVGLPCDLDHLFRVIAGTLLPSRGA